MISADIPTIMGKPNYTIHIVDTSTKRKLNEQLKGLLSTASPTKSIGAYIEMDNKLSIMGDREKYEEVMRLTHKQLKTASPAPSNSEYLNVLPTTDVEDVARNIGAEAAEGRRTLLGMVRRRFPRRQ